MREILNQKVTTFPLPLSAIREGVPMCPPFTVATESLSLQTKVSDVKSDVCEGN